LPRRPTVFLAARDFALFCGLFSGNVTVVLVKEVMLFDRKGVASDKIFLNLAKSGLRFFLQPLGRICAQNARPLKCRQRQLGGEMIMKRLLNYAIVSSLALVIFGAGVTEISAQKRKPVLRRSTTKRVVKPVTPVYTVPSGTVIRSRMNSTISSKTVAVGSTFTATVTEPVYSSTGEIVIPTGSTLTGRVDEVKRAGKGGNPGTIDVSFVSVRLPNGRVRAINGSLTDLDSKSAKSDNEGSASGDKMKNRKIIFIGGGGAGGAILGAAIGGGKGAAIGAIAGAVGGLIGERMTKGEEATVKSGTEFGVYLNQPISLPKFVPVNP
jgi:hypothetical protein